MKIRPNLAVILILFTVTMALYSKAAYFQFSVMDDNDYVYENAYVTTGLSVNSIKWAFTSFHASNWHPVTWLSLMIDSQLFGVNPIGYHLVNVLLHALNTSLLFVLFNSMTGALWRSAFVAACFALHPLHVESVAWIAERKDVLSALFFMLTLLFYTVYVKKTKRSMYVVSLVAFALGLMAKPMLVTLPVVLLLLDFWPLERMKISFFERKRASAEHIENKDRCRFRYLLVEKIPYILLSAVSALLTLFAQSGGGAVASLTQFSLSMRINNALWSVVTYVRKMFFPFDLAVFYPFVTVPIWKAVCALVLICAILSISARLLQRYPWLATGWLWFLITLTPVIGLIQVGSQSMADRYTYIPLIGLFTMASWGGGELYAQQPKLRNTISLVAGGVLLLLAMTTSVQLGYWRDSITLFRHSLGITHDRITSHFLHFSLGTAYEKQGKTDLAIEEYREAVQYDPDDPRAHSNLGNLLNKQGKSKEAISHFEQAFRLNPRFAQAHYNMGVSMAMLGRIDEAVREYNEALRIEPDNAMYHNNIGAVLAQQGLLDEAIQHFSQAIHLNPNDEKAGVNLQTALKLKSQMPVK